MTDLLPSWTDGAARAAITAFVDRVTSEGDPAFVPPAERVAVFDNVSIRDDWRRVFADAPA